MTQQEALEILKMGHSVYLTGAAGSGKTFLLNEYINFLKDKGVKIGVTASTGIAATHLNGVTIHSWSGIGINDKLAAYDFERLSKRKTLANKIRRTNVLVIDEVSMLHSFRLDLVDEVCRFFRDSHAPFGGIQVVLCGDFFQLPPIGRSGVGVDFVNKSQVWNYMNLKVCYLHEQHRHSDNILIQALNEIRENRVSEDTMRHLRKRYKKDLDNILPTKLYTHNIDVDAINKKHLDDIEAPVHTHNMNVTKGSRVYVEALKKSCLAPEKLSLKKGAIVMFVKNNPEKKYFNGTLGVVRSFDSLGCPIVETMDGRSIFVSQEDWAIEEDGKVKASVSQLPLRLAWAITIHKSQGMSLDAAEIDLSKSFVDGMGYVALSRIKTLDGLRLMGLNDIALKVNDEVLEFDESLRNLSEKAMEELSKFHPKEKEKIQKNYLKSISPVGGVSLGSDKLSTYDITKSLVMEKVSLKEMAEERGMSQDTIISHLEKIVERGDRIDDLEYLKPKEGRFEKIKAVFEKNKDKKLTPARRALGPLYSFIEIRLARLFL